MKELWPPDGWTDIGPDQKIRRARDPEGFLHIIEAHKDTAGEWCTGWASTNPEDIPHWTLVSEEPLELHPSLQCSQCGNHGHIQGGVWKPAARSEVPKRP